MSAEDIDKIDSQDIYKLYMRYVAQLGSNMAKTQGQTVIQLHATVFGQFLPIPAESQPKLVCDLGANPFVSHAVATAAFELYYRYGFYKAPKIAAMTTVKYCQFEKMETIVNKDERESDYGENNAC